MNVTYIHHSGFLIEYFQGTIPALNVENDFRKTCPKCPLLLRKWAEIQELLRNEEIKSSPRRRYPVSEICAGGVLMASHIKSGIHIVYVLLIQLFP